MKILSIIVYIYVFALFLHLLYVRTLVCFMFVLYALRKASKVFKGVQRCSKVFGDTFLEDSYLKIVHVVHVTNFNVELLSVLFQTLVQNKLVVVMNFVFLIL